MRNVGARNGYIRAPFLVEGIIIGIIGSLVPILAMIFSYYYLFNNFNGVVLGVSKKYAVSPLPKFPNILLVAALNSKFLIPFISKSDFTWYWCFSRYHWFMDFSN